MRLVRHVLRTWFQSARLLYVFLLAFVVNIFLSEVQLIITNGWDSVFNLDQLRATYFWHLAATYPVYFWLAFALILIAAGYGFLLDRRLRSDNMPANLPPLRRVRALDIFRDLHDRQGEGFFLNDLGEVAFERGQFEEADHSYRQSVDILRDVKDRQGEGVALYGVGRAALQRQRLEAAEETLQQAPGVMRKESDPYYESKILYALAEVAEAKGGLRAAEAHAQERLEVAKSGSLEQEIADAQHVLARIYDSQHQETSG
jgi:tetratricopeptide (TPR) repeat protein